MSRFFVGQPVKKVRGSNVGTTGRVSGFDPTDERSLAVVVDQAGIGWKDDDTQIIFSAGDEVYGFPGEFEPILPEGQRPAELGVHELLPFLKERVTA